MSDFSEGREGAAAVSVDQLLPPSVFMQKEDVMQHNHPYLSFHIKRAWNHEYASEVAAYVVQHSRPLDESVRESLANFAWGGDDITRRRDNLQVFDALHAAEAEARGLTNWEYQQLLFIQERIAGSGVQVDSLVKQRDLLLSMLDLKEGESLSTRGAKISGLAAVSFECWVLAQIDPVQAKSLQDRVTQKFGKQLYVATVARRPASPGEMMDSDVAIMADSLAKKAYTGARSEASEFLQELPPRDKVKLSKQLTELDLKLVGEAARQGVAEVQHALTDTVSKIKRSNVAG